MLFLPCPVKFVTLALFQKTQRQLVSRAEAPFKKAKNKPTDMARKTTADVPKCQS